MKNVALFILLMLSSFQVIAIQNGYILDLNNDSIYQSNENPSPEKTIEYYEDKIIVTYKFNKVLIQSDDIFTQKVTWNYDGFSLNTISGEPAFAFRNDNLNIPAGVTPQIEILETQKKEYSYEIAPARPSLTANDDIIYNSNNIAPISTTTIMPLQIVERIGEKSYRGNRLTSISIHPFQYDDTNNKVYAYTTIKYAINFIDENMSTIQTDATIAEDDYFFSQIKYPTENCITPYAGDITTIEKEFLIITTPDLGKAAKEFAEWKRALGYKTFTKTSDNWTPTSIKDAVKEHYASNPNLYYLVIIGDNTKVPSQKIADGLKRNYHYSDMYYACVDTENDKMPDLYYGRFPAENIDDALTMIRKSIDYEKNPSEDKSYLETAVFCSYFETGINKSIADQDFIWATEKVLNNVSNKYSNITRIYSKDKDATPKYYINGTELPLELQEPNFAWDGGTVDIYNAVNNGCSMFFHRDHGYTTGWKEPWLELCHIGHMKNKNKYPVLFSIDCYVGRFEAQDSCFTTRVLKHKDGGFAAVISATQESYTYENGNFAIGMFDAIFPKEETTIPTYTLGEIRAKGLEYMSSLTRPSISLFQSEIYHIFGDPSITLYWKKREPLKDRLQITKDNNSFSVYSVNPDYDNYSHKIYVSRYNRRIGRTERYYSSEIYFSDYSIDETVVISSPGYTPIVYELKSLHEDTGIEIVKPDITNCHIIPSSGIVIVKTTDLESFNDAYSIQIRNSNGRIIRSTDTDKCETIYSFDIADEPSGIYVATLVSNGVIISSKQILK